MSKGKPADFFSDSFKDLVGRMLELKERRISMEEIYQHPWFVSDDVPTYEEIK